MSDPRTETPGDLPAVEVEVVVTIPETARTVVEPAVLNGRYEQQHQPVEEKEEEEVSGADGLTMDQEMKITDSIEDQGLLESSMRLKPHEAQSYRQKALWVSWVSIAVTIMLAIAAFTNGHWSTRPPLPYHDILLRLRE
ncbi:hypothetical protein NHX12_014725 [Muraenolepis orangiensis]|uniref:Transmembrane protein n=1 Tax=Muraenolepis orangiensis TaxID=630683 RepID=A0A9Q0I385_9TELE|nr:hypothetical protein NHX12_014724 [Muraenolepis orangiensis]KAJ3584229.1 hypothetical protein NHX12_014725 [Muraenolepis orangiensis]